MIILIVSTLYISKTHYVEKYIYTFLHEFVLQENKIIFIYFNCSHF